MLLSKIVTVVFTVTMLNLLLFCRWPEPPDAALWEQQPGLSTGPSPPAAPVLTPDSQRHQMTKGQRELEARHAAAVARRLLSLLIQHYLHAHELTATRQRFPTVQACSTHTSRTGLS